MAIGKKTLLLFFVFLIMGIFSLSGCGSSSPAGGGGTGGGGTGGGTISGVVFNTPNGAMKALSTPLLGASVIAGNASATTTATGAYSIGGLGGTTTLSAAAAGFYAQTMDGIPTTAGQDIHLNPLMPPATATASSSATITGLVLASTGAPAPFVGVQCQDAAGNIWGWATTNASGTYSIPVTLYNGVTSGQVTIYVAQQNWTTGDLTGLGYTTANVNANVTAPAPNITVQPVTIAGSIPVTVNNIPAGANYGVISVSMKLPTGISIGLSGKWGGAMFGTALPTIFNASAVAIPGITYDVYASYQTPVTAGSPQGVAYAARVNLAPGPLTISLLNIPAITGPVPTGSVASTFANAPTALSWSAVPGAVQYSVGINSVVWPSTYGWTGITSATSVTKPLFDPLSGGNLTVGTGYSLSIWATDTAFFGTTAASPVNPYMKSPSAMGSPSGFVYNQVPQGNYTQSGVFYTLSAM